MHSKSVVDKHCVNDLHNFHHTYIYIYILYIYIYITLYSSLGRQVVNVPLK